MVGGNGVLLSNDNGTNNRLCCVHIEHRGGGQIATLAKKNEKMQIVMVVLWPKWRIAVNSLVDVPTNANQSTARVDEPSVSVCM